MRSYSRSILIFCSIGFLLAGCISQGEPVSAAKKSSSASSSGSTSTSSSSTDSQCTIFQSNSNDYSNCLACKQTLCSCAPNCTTSQIYSCSVNINSLAQCVHNNTFPSGGSCVGLVCGDSQVADFTSCSCKDAVPPGSIQATPGTEDGGIARMEVGYSITNRYCSVSKTNASGTAQENCLTTNDISTNGTLIPSALPPINVFQDLGYLRWDLSLDASQYSADRSLENDLPQLTSQSTIQMNQFFSYQLKPNTALSSYPYTINWRDCVEHFSGYQPTATDFVSSLDYCADRSVGSLSAPVPATVGITANSSTGSATKLNISMNGTASNSNQLTFSPTGNPHLNFTSANSSVDSTNFGLMKRNTGDGISAATTDGLGLLSNIGYYKYTWGPLQLKNTKTGATIASSNKATGSMAINMNMGYTPVSAVDSTALSPDALTNTLNGRTCSNSAVRSQCVVTTVYRGSGGSVLTQSFSPRFSNNNHAGNVTSLPSGIIAVSTPKVVEDISQDLSTSKAPARLRTFVRAADGNIYMSRYHNNKWNSWMSLGRPWVCDGGGTACSNLVASSIANIYKPIDITAAPYSAMGTPPSTPLSNDGISIVGEPVVASYMDTSGATVEGRIIVFVRVSNILSSDGTAGPLHNAIFFTYASATSLSTNDTYDFDDATKWKGWYPVQRAGSIFRTLGNPVAYMNRYGATRMVGLIGISNGGLLHPPIAQSTTNQANTTNVQAGFYNYGNELRYTSINVDNIGTGTPPADTDWVAFGTDSNLNGTIAGAVIASDLGFGVVADAAGVNTTLGIFAKVLKTSGASASYNSPYNYSDQVFYWQYILNNANLSFDGYEESFTNLHFTGTPWPVNLTSFTNYTFASGAGKNLFLFGRQFCENKIYCDPVNPTLSYAGLTLAGAACGGGACAYSDFAQYLYGYSIDEAAAVTNSPLRIQPNYVSSDVIPIISQALRDADYDVPVYLFTRAPNGTLQHSFWGQTGGSSGNPIFQVYTKGAYTN